MSNTPQAIALFAIGVGWTVATRAAAAGLLTWASHLPFLPLFVCCLAVPWLLRGGK